MVVSFVLPGVCDSPVGGYKVVYEYANRLVREGHAVYIFFAYDTILKQHTQIPTFIKKGIYWYKYPKKITWFDLDNRIQRKLLWKICDDTIADADAIIATAIETAEPISKLSIKKGRKFYFIQGFENWNYSDDKVLKSYKLGMQNIVIARWLKNIVDRASGKDSFFIRNGIDTEQFYIERPIINRSSHTLAFMYHNSELKGIPYGFETIRMLKEHYSDLKVYMFGTPKRPDGLPEWIDYTCKANTKQLREIYNKSSVYMCSSIVEGFGLTGAESMACGCALVSTKTKGVNEYAMNEQNALLCEPKDAKSLFECVIRIFDDQELRVKIAEAGAKTIQEEMNIEISFQKLLCKLI